VKFFGDFDAANSPAFVRFYSILDVAAHFFAIFRVRFSRFERGLISAVEVSSFDPLDWEVIVGLTCRMPIFAGEECGPKWGSEGLRNSVLRRVEFEKALRNPGNGEVPA
jgi:hypothetical protein